MLPNNEEKDALGRRMAELAKSLRRANTQLNEFGQVRVSMDSLIKQIREIVERTANKPELQEALTRELQSQQIFELFDQLQSQFSQLKKTVLELEEPLLQETVFLENHRSHRHYSFSSQEQTLTFLRQLAELYSLHEFLFKPEFIGMVDFQPLEKELNLKKKDKSSFVVPLEQLEPLFAFLVSRKFSKNFRLDSEPIKILLQSTAKLKVEADNNAIKRLDRLAISLEGHYLEK